MSSPRHILLTGIPGIGKTTVFRKIELNLSCHRNSIDIFGFYTSEVRKDNFGRIGFDIINFENKQLRKPIARVIQPQQQGLTGPQVGKYSVDVLSFEEIALPVINKALNIERDKNTIVIIDEIGKMEMFSEMFRRGIKQLFDQSIECKSLRLLVTIPLKNSIPFVEELRKRNDVKEIEVKKSNRNELADDIVQMLISNAVK